jgi:hypothetical protein
LAARPVVPPKGGGMAKLWKTLTRQRPFWPPDWSFVAVILLSIVLGVWPLADPQWTKKGAYLAAVIAMLILGSLISAQQRWKLEERYRFQRGVQIAGLQARTWDTMKEVSELGERWRKSLPDSDARYSEFSGPAVRAIGIMRELAEHDVLAPRRLKEVFDRGLAGNVAPEDCSAIVALFHDMSQRLEKLSD